MSKTFSLKHVVIIALFCIVSSVAVTIMAFQALFINQDVDIMPGNTVASDEMLLNDKLQEIKALVDKYYVGEVDAQIMADMICTGYVAGLNDRYSAYVNKENAQESLNTLYGVNSGIGVQITQHPDNMTMYVLEVHKDSPAEKAGIVGGDEIISVDGKIVAEYGYSETLNYIKSLPLESNVHIVINRDNNNISVDVTLTQFISQSVFYKIFGDKGYISITSFNDRTPEQFKLAVESLSDLGATALIIDLRGNGGGTLNSVYEMLDYVIPEGLAIKVTYKNDNMNEVYMSDANEINLPIVCLTDENTASAAELFVQGMKDYNKAISIGRVTFGKGVVQRTYTLSDGSLVKFTVGKYYTANGTCLDSIGVTPDISVEYPAEELKYRFVNGIENDKDFIEALKYLNAQ